MISKHILPRYIMYFCIQRLIWKNLEITNFLKKLIYWVFGYLDLKVGKTEIEHAKFNLQLKKRV